MIKQLQELQDKLQRQWETCQSGVRHCKNNDKDSNRLLVWLRKHKSRNHDLWVEILCGNRPELCKVLENQRFPQGDGFWRQMVTSSPFRLLDIFRD